MAGKSKTKQANSKIRIADNGYKFPEQLPVGEILIDSLKNEWVLGKAFARGGFGEIYEARPSLIKSNFEIKKNKDFEYVVKVDHLQGPLFCEMNFYVRAAKREFITKWMAEKGIKFIGMPAFVATGTHTKGNELLKKTKTAANSIPTRYRFLVMPRFGSDLQKILDLNKLRLPLKTAYTIGIKVLDILEYIHSQGYIHADIKASNLLLSFNKAKDSDLHDEIWLVDFGLVEKYLQGDNRTHKPYGEDLRRANNGTIEFTSRDAHIGCFSRKGDIEILAYNLLSWLSGGRLPWMPNLSDKTLVKNLKNSYMNRLDDLFNYAFMAGKSETVTNNSKSKSLNKSQIPDGISEFFKQVIKMKYDEKPNYKQLRSTLEKAITNNGEKYDGKFYLIENDKKKSFVKSPKDKISPLKRKHPSSKSIVSEESNYSDITVIFDQSTEEEDEIVISSAPKKSRTKASSNGVNSNSLRSSARKSPTVLNAKVASNGTSKTPININTTNGKSSAKSNGQLLLNENGINKLNNELIIINNDQIIVDNVDTSDIKTRRRNPSRKVKNEGFIDSPTALNENNKFVNEPVKNGCIKSTKVFKTDLKSENQNQIVFQGKVFSNPTPAMLELFNRLNGKIK